mgnify:FL=1
MSNDNILGSNSVLRQVQYTCSELSDTCDVQGVFKERV